MYGHRYFGQRYFGGHYFGDGGSGISAAVVAAAIWAATFDGYKASDLLRIIAAVAAGKTTVTDLGNHQATVLFRQIDDDADMVVATMDHSNRVNVVITP